jgi:hypothetical protein
MDGSIKLHRCLLDSQVFAHQVALKIWIWCLCKATWKERYTPFKTNGGEKIIKLMPGQFIFGRFKAEEELGIDGSTIYKWLQKFTSPEFEMIEINSNNKYSIITICKWKDYQIDEKRKVTAKEQHSNNTVTTGEQHSNTNNKVNNVYNVYYDTEILKSENDENYVSVVKVLYGENNLCKPLDNVLKMRDQLSYEQFKKMWQFKTRYNIGIAELLEKMQDWNKLKERTSLYLTFLTFMKRRYPEITEK